jgi:hypothetical protein
VIIGQTAFWPFKTRVAEYDERRIQGSSARRGGLESGSSSGGAEGDRQGAAAGVVAGAAAEEEEEEEGSDVLPALAQGRHTLQLQSPLPEAGAGSAADGLQRTLLTLSATASHGLMGGGGVAPAPALQWRALLGDVAERAVPDAMLDFVLQLASPTESLAEAAADAMTAAGADAMTAYERPAQAGAAPRSSKVAAAAAAVPLDAILRRADQAAAAVAAAVATPKPQPFGGAGPPSGRPPWKTDSQEVGHGEVEDEEERRQTRWEAAQLAAAGAERGEGGGSGGGGGGELRGLAGAMACQIDRLAQAVESLREVRGRVCSK